MPPSPSTAARASAPFTAGSCRASWASPTSQCSSRSTRGSRSSLVRTLIPPPSFLHRACGAVTRSLFTFSLLAGPRFPFPERHSHDRPVPAHTILFCSAVAKMTASVATYPHEVVRTRLQTQRRLLLPSGAPRKRSGIVRTTRKIIHFEGWRGLYKGLSVNLLRTVPNSAVTMLSCVLFLLGAATLFAFPSYRVVTRFFFLFLWVSPVQTGTNCSCASSRCEGDSEASLDGPLTPHLTRTRTRLPSFPAGVYLDGTPHSIHNLEAI